MRQRYQVNKKKFDSEPFYDDKHIKTKIKPYNGRTNINFLEKSNQRRCALRSFFCDIIRFLLLR